MGMDQSSYKLLQSKNNLYERSKDSWDCRAKRDLKGLARTKLREHYISKEKGRKIFQQDRNYSKGGQKTYIYKTERFFLTCFSGKVLLTQQRLLGWIIERNVWVFQIKTKAVHYITNHQICSPLYKDIFVKVRCLDQQHQQCV